MAQLPQRLRLDLPDALARQLELFADLLELVIGNCSPRYLGDEDYPEGVSEETLEAVLEFISASWGDEDQVRAMMPSEGEDASYRRAAAKLLRMSMTPQTARKQYEYILRRLDVRDVLASIRVPTLVFHSSQMPLIPIEQARYVVGRIEGATLIEIPGADASVFGAAIDDVCDDIEEFLTGVRPAPQVDRALATVLFTDIVSSTNHAAQLGDRAWRLLLDRHDAGIARELDRHRGRKVNPTGDGLLATFDGPARAVRCAQAIIEVVRPLGIEVRAGLHTGEVELRGDDIGGIAVHIGQRVSALAGPGEILTSSTVKDLVAGSGISFADRGMHALKGVPEEWRLFAVES